MKSRIFIVVTVVVVTVCLPLRAYADDEQTPVYESLADISVGTLFFSAQQREQLDALRAGRVLRKTAVATGVSRKRDALAAGFIAASSGKSRVFRDGDFRPGDVDEDMPFPVDVDIIVKTSVEKAATTSASDTGEDEAP